MLLHRESYRENIVDVIPYGRDRFDKSSVQYCDSLASFHRIRMNLKAVIATMVFISAPNIPNPIPAPKIR